MATAHLLGAPVLVLNSSYEPIHVCAAKRALILLFKGIAQPEVVTASLLHSASMAINVPSVIRLLEYRRIPCQTRSLSRKNILARDRYTCQYCNRGCAMAELTLDHVLPRSRGGASSWENLVAACRRCNNRKGDRLPEEANMRLKKRPKPFTLHTSRSLMRQMGNQQETWRKYLFY
jgi:5-methylcytosine-specific restriction endonuclease McrA